MSGEGQGPRRAVAELHWDDGSDPVERVGGRSLHQYWPVLSPYFRDVLLPPLRRTDTNAVSWTWHEPEGARAATAAELRGLRSRLRREQELLAENLSRAAVATGDAEAQRRGTSIHGLDVAMRGVIERLVAGSDAELAGYVCRTELGLRLHSWGAPAPASVQYPDTRRPEEDGADDRVASLHEHDQTTEASTGRRRKRVLGAIGLCAVLMAGLGWVIWPEAAGSTREEGANVRGKTGSPTRRAMAAPGDKAAASRAGSRVVVARAGNDGGAQAAPAIRAEARVEESASSGKAETPASSEEIVGVSRPPRSTPLSLAEPEMKRLPSPAEGRPDGPNPASGSRREGVIADGDSKKGAERNSDAVRSEGEPETKSATTIDVRVTKVRIRADDEDATELPTTKRTELETENPRDDESLEKRTPDDVVVRARTAGTEVGLAWDRAMTGEAKWDRVTTVRFSQWQIRLLGDVILPTRPMRWSDGEDDRSMRARALEDLRGRMPATLRELQMRAGIGFEVGGGRDGSRMRWRGADGAFVGAGTFRDGRIELSWDELQQLGGTRWFLEHESEGRLAEVGLAADAESASVATIEGVRAYQWFAATIVGSDDRDSAARERLERFRWRRVTDSALPAGWRERRIGMGGRELRVEVPIEGTAETQSLALFDRETGWAAVSELAYRAAARIGTRE